MQLSIWSNPTFWSLFELFIWIFGAFLIGLYFGKKLNIHEPKQFEHTTADETLPLEENTIRATKTFERGGKQYIDVKTETKTELDFNLIGTASESEKDNLKAIKGIGKTIEKKLNGLGIYTYKQISNLTSKDIKTINELLKFFPGRIERDDWIGQAFNKTNQKL